MPKAFSTNPHAIYNVVFCLFLLFLFHIQTFCSKQTEQRKKEIDRLKKQQHISPDFQITRCRIPHHYVHPAEVLLVKKTFKSSSPTVHNSLQKNNSYYRKLLHQLFSEKNDLLGMSCYNIKCNEKGRYLGHITRNNVHGYDSVQQ